MWLDLIWNGKQKKECLQLVWLLSFKIHVMTHSVDFQGHKSSLCINSAMREQQSMLREKPHELLLLLSRFSRVRLCVTPQTAAHQVPHPWDSPGKNTGVGCHFLLQCMEVKSESEVAQSCPTLATPWTAAYPAPPSVGLSRQEYWSGVPLPSPLMS